MMRVVWMLASISWALLAALPGAIRAQDPIFVEVGACPGESCTYGVWRAAANLTLRSGPSGTAPVTGSIPRGDLVCALTGEVHTVPGVFDVVRGHGRFAPGDSLFVLTYRGEGWFLVEVDGARFEEDLGFSPWGGSAGRRCEGDPRCWGVLREDLEFDWWVQVDDLEGTEGWVLEDRAFDKLVHPDTDPALFQECSLRRDPGADGSEKGRRAVG